MAQPVTVIGGGLAGCEAAWQLARRGVQVRLCEMRPLRESAAHTTDALAELVCSNSLRSDRVAHAVGLLHEELRRLGSLIMDAADKHALPAGSALAVDRGRFARHVTERIMAEPGIELVREEVTALPDAGLTIVATGPLTSDGLAEQIQPLCGESLYFYDSISPTVYIDSLDTSVMFRGSRWEEGVEGDYWNVPLSREQYAHFIDAVLAADKVPLQRFEEALYFEGCLPIEVMAERGRETLAFGPLKPVGLEDPKTEGGRAHAVIQLRQEDREGTLYNLVGFQTKMRIGEQKRILRELPGFEKAVFARFGSAHRNTFIRAPELLEANLEHRARPGLYFAGQIAGVEGYVESTGLGLLAGIFVAARVAGSEPLLPPPVTALGALLRHLRESKPKNFQPMNVNYGLFPMLEGERRRVPKKERNEKMSARALSAIDDYVERVRP